MNRDILPLLDNDVLTLIGKEVIKIRDRKTLEYWMEFYTPRRLRIINRLYGDLNRKIIIQTISNFNYYYYCSLDRFRNYNEDVDVFLPTIQKMKKLEHKFIIDIDYWESWFDREGELIDYETESEESEDEEEEARFRWVVREFYGQ